MITNCAEAMSNCEKFRDIDGFCTRNCACSGLSFGGCTSSMRDAAREEAKAAGLAAYQLMTGKCGDMYIIPMINGRII